MIVPFNVTMAHLTLQMKWLFLIMCYQKIIIALAIYWTPVKYFPIFFQYFHYSVILIEKNIENSTIVEFSIFFLPISHHFLVSVKKPTVEVTKEAPIFVGPHKWRLCLIWKMFPIPPSWEVIMVLRPSEVIEAICSSLWGQYANFTQPHFSRLSL